jgi:class 3 adenylate cyclase/tetratricopeptide (TPR) repeat protein
MKCQGCQHENNAAAKFCQECGSALARHCLACGGTLGLAAKFCPECGAVAGVEGSVAARAVAPAPQQFSSDASGSVAGDRRQAAVLFVDISGYSAQCARSDAEQVQAMLSRFFDAMDRVIETYGGHVIDRIGDAVMVVFGAPVAHGNDAERAVRAALEMHNAATTLVDCDGQPLRLHIGVASGEVVAATIGTGVTSKYSVTGDAVNLAARLVASATDDETLISESLRGLVFAAVEAQALGERAIKGLAAPVPIWKLLGLRDVRPEHSPLVGRHAELAQVSSAMDVVRDRGTGLTIFVRGDAGIGKSRLVTEFRERARQRGFDVPLGQVLDFGVGKGQDAVPTVLKAVLNVATQADNAARRLGVDLGLASGLIEGDEELFVNEWLDLRQPSALKAIFDAMDNTTRIRRSGEALAAVLRRAAARQPRLVIFEDIHWAAADLLPHLAAITQVAAQAPLILVLTSRIEGDPLDKTWRAAVHACPLLTIDLAPLRAQDAQLMAGTLLQGSSGFAQRCVARAEGNPLFLEQLLRAGSDSEATSVPPTIQSLVLERVDRLAAHDRSAVQAASVIGKRFALDSLRAISTDPGAGIDALVAADLVRRDGSGFLFAHALIQEAVYASILKSIRRDLHRRAAAWFGDAEPVLQAEHLDRGEDPGAAHAYLVAAIHQTERFRYEIALRLAERGAVLIAAAPIAGAATACELALLRGEVLREMGRSSDSIDGFRAATELARDDLQRCHAWMGVAAGDRITGAFDDAMDALNQAQPIAERLDLPEESSKIHHTRGNLLFAQGKVAECDAQHQRALAHAVRSGNLECEAQALSGLGDAQYAQGRMQSALAYFQRCVELCAGHAWVRIEGPNRCMSGHCLWYQNRIGEAIEEARHACDVAHRYGVVPVQVFAQASLTQFLIEAGRAVDAELACEAGLALARAAGSRRYESLLLMGLAGLRLQQGRRVDARQALERALELARESGLGFAGAALYGRLARVVTEPDERAQALSEGEALLRGPSLAHGHLWFYRDAIEASIAAAEWAPALRYADSLEAFVSPEPLPWALLIVARCRALADLALGRDRELSLARLLLLRTDVDQAGIGWALADIDAALAL